MYKIKQNVFGGYACYGLKHMMTSRPLDFKLLMRMIFKCFIEISNSYITVYTNIKSFREQLHCSDSNIKQNICVISAVIKIAFCSICLLI